MIYLSYITIFVSLASVVYALILAIMSMQKPIEIRMKYGSFLDLKNIDNSYSIKEGDLCYSLMPKKNYQYTFGRDIDASIRALPDQLAVSRNHFCIFWTRGEWMIEDLQSTNGTRLNGQLIKPQTAVKLHYGDTIEAGNISMQVQKAQTE